MNDKTEENALEELLGQIDGAGELEDDIADVDDIVGRFGDSAEFTADVFADTAAADTGAFGSDDAFAVDDALGGGEALSPEFL